MAKLENLNWTDDLVASSTLTNLALDALAILVDYIPDDKLKEASERVDLLVSETAESNANSSSTVEGAEIARSAFSQIIRR